MSFISEYTTVQKLLAVKHPVIFYAETRHYYQYFQQLIDDLLNQKSPTLVYITSDKNDPLLAKAPDGMTVFFVRWWLAFLFPRLKAAVVVMTMTDLGNYAFKRSKDVSTYVYIFHAAVSTHQQYTQKAFYHYDAIFATGPYQANEIRAAEKIYNLPGKQIINYGYPVIDMLELSLSEQDQQNPKTKKQVILIAPSWFQGCIFDTCLTSLLEQLLLLPYEILIRPHPEYVKRNKKKFASLKKWAAQYASITFDYSRDVIQSLLHADILITDRSGIAIEFALGTRKPVLFIETAHKITNPHWKELGIEPIENSIRSETGLSILPEQIGSIAATIDQINILKNSFPERARQIKSKLLYNSPASGKSGADYIISQI